VAIAVFYIAEKFVESPKGGIGYPLAPIVLLTIPSRQTIFTDHGGAVTRLLENGPQIVGVGQGFIKLVVPNRLMPLVSP
jgi:hypothetical protein